MRGVVALRSLPKVKMAAAETNSLQMTEAGSQSRVPCAVLTIRPMSSQDIFLNLGMASVTSSLRNN